jgi:hypothetical protein
MKNKKIFLLFFSFLLTGCGTPYVKYRFTDTNAVVIKPNGQQESASLHPVVPYPEIKQQLDSGKCASVKTPTIIWNDGTRLNPYLINVCGTHNDHYVTKPSQQLLNQNQQSTLQPVPLTSPTPTTSQSNTVSIDEAKKKCTDLGFKTGTEGFGKCVLQLSK